MLLYVMRHGPAEDRGPSGGDSDRRLTPEGRDLVQSAAARLLRLRCAPVPRLLSSPLTRARETAEIVRSVAGAPGVVVEQRRELAAETPAAGLAAEMLERGADALLVGHQPTAELLVHLLTSGGAPGLGSGFRTAMIVCLALDGRGGWRVASVLDPRVPV